MISQSLIFILQFDPATKHHYQAAYTSVAGGVYADAGRTKSHYEDKYVVRDQSELLSKTPGVNWIKQAVTTFDPHSNSISLSDGSKVTYDYLVVNPGLSLRFDQIEGAQEALDDPDAPVSSMYTL